jgi:hypothetical protein
MDVTNMEEGQTAQLDSIMTDIYLKNATIRYVSSTPTTSTVRQNELVIYDDGAGTKRIYTITAKGNLGYVTLT